MNQVDKAIKNLTNKTLIAKRIKALRESKNYSQEYLSFQLQMSQTGYGKMERGEVNFSVERVLWFCDFYNVAPSDFLAEKFRIEI